MTEAVERLKTEARSLTSLERADLAHFLLPSLDQGEDADAEAAWDAELARRAADLESDQAQGIPADQVFAEIRKKHQ
jgi:putative addiction module component (TIGR02574 family)